MKSAGMPVSGTVSDPSAPVDVSRETSSSARTEAAVEGTASGAGAEVLDPRGADSAVGQPSPPPASEAESPALATGQPSPDVASPDVDTRYPILVRGGDLPAAAPTVSGPAAAP